METEVRVIRVGMRTQKDRQVLDSVDLQVEGTEPINLRDLRVVVDWPIDESTFRREVLWAQEWDMELAPWTRIRIQLGPVDSPHPSNQPPVCIRMREKDPLEVDGIGDLQVLFQDDKLLDYVTIDVDANPVWYRDPEDRR